MQKLYLLAKSFPPNAPDKSFTSYKRILEPKVASLISTQCKFLKISNSFIFTAHASASPFAVHSKLTLKENICFYSLFLQIIFHIFLKGSPFQAFKSNVSQIKKIFNYFSFSCKPSVNMRKLLEERFLENYTILKNHIIFFVNSFTLGEIYFISMPLISMTKSTN